MKKSLSEQLLKWYAKSGRDLPWRIKGGAHPNPYAVLVSELMLQQTGVKTVIPYFERFMTRFPTIRDLASASLEEVYLYWQGLGYYSRARSLHATAQMIVGEYNGIFPQNKKDVLKLKGIGPYTVASFLALAFNQPETAVDGNVIRVICRLYRLTEPVSEIMDVIRQKAEELTDRKYPADYTSAIMDLGAMVCTPKNPQCLLCPWQEFCISKGSADLEKIPNRAKPAKKKRCGRVYVICNSKGEVFIRRRTEKGLLSGLYEFPWCEEGELFSEYKIFATEKKVSHIFTHINLCLDIYTFQAEEISLDGVFVAPEALKDYPLSTLMKKVYRAFCA